MSNEQVFRITATLHLDVGSYPPDDEQCQDWLVNDILLGDLDRLTVISAEIGDEVGRLVIERVEGPGRRPRRRVRHDTT